MARQREYGHAGRPERHLVLVPGPAGRVKVYWRFREPDELTAYVRFAIRDQTSTFHAAELRVLEPWLDRYRELPLRRVERGVNADEAVSRHLAERYNAPEPADVAAHFGQTPARREQAEQRFRLSRPEKRRLPDSFYVDVATAYRDAVAAGLDPRKTLATDSGTPADTVARWIGQARKHGHLPPGEQGKVTASGWIKEDDDG
jgi:hypothetical protein